MAQKPRRCEDIKVIVASEFSGLLRNSPLLTEQTRQIYGLADPTGQ